MRQDSITSVCYRAVTQYVVLCTECTNVIHSITVVNVSAVAVW